MSENADIADAGQQLLPTFDDQYRAWILEPPMGGERVLRNDLSGLGLFAFSPLNDVRWRVVPCEATCLQNFIVQLNNICILAVAALVMGVPSAVLAKLEPGELQRSSQKAGAASVHAHHHGNPWL